MPIVYDNWGRLFEAVMRRQQYLEMAHAHSRTCSTSAASSVSFEFDELSLSLPDGEMAREEQGLDGNGLESRNSLSSNDANRSEAEWIEQYEIGVYVTVVEFLDGIRDIKRVRFSRRRYTENQAEIWWAENRKNVYKKYNIRGIYGFSASNNVVPRGTNGSNSSNSLGLKIVDANLTEVLWIEQYEPGVYVTIVALQDGSRDIKRALFSLRRFSEDEAETWWSKNWKNVCKKYNVRNFRGVDVL